MDSIDKARLRDRIAGKYIRPLFAYALNRTSSSEEARDFLGEIVLQVYLSLSKGREIRNFDAWIWRVAAYTWH